jgi:uncharacterized membrane protein
MDENAQYLLLAFFWFFSSPITGKKKKKHVRKVMDWTSFNLLFIVTLIPFFTFSAFHALGYIRTNVIPNVFPRPATTTGSGEASTVTWQAKTQQQIKSLTDKYYGDAMRFVAQSEVTVIAVRLFFGLFR